MGDIPGPAGQSRVPPAARDGHQALCRHVMPGKGWNQRRPHGGQGGRGLEGEDGGCPAAPQGWHSLVGALLPSCRACPSPGQQRPSRSAATALGSSLLALPGNSALNTCPGSNECPGHWADKGAAPQQGVGPCHTGAQSSLSHPGRRRRTAFGISALRLSRNSSGIQSR